jgi:hypothetical protein
MEEMGDKNNSYPLAQSQASRRDLEQNHVIGGKAKKLCCNVLFLSFHFFKRWSYCIVSVIHIRLRYDQFGISL